MSSTPAPDGRGRASRLCSSGESEWLDSAHTIEERELQISQVFALLTWRVGFIEAPYTPTQAAQYGMARSSVKPYPNPAFTYSNGEYYVTPAMQALWSNQAQQALAANPYMPSPGGYAGLLASINTGRGTTEVDIERQVDVVPLAKYAATEPSLYSPLANVPINGGELFVEQQWGVIPRSPTPHALPITAVAKPVSANYAVQASDENFVGGTSLGTGTEVDPKPRMWARQVPDSVFEQPGTASNPVFVPQVLVRYNAPEPPSGWPPTSFGYFPANVYFVNTVVERVFDLQRAAAAAALEADFGPDSSARFDFDAEDRPPARALAGGRATGQAGPRGRAGGARGHTAGRAGREGRGGRGRCDRLGIH